SSLWCENVWSGVAEPLASGELFALAIGCDVCRGRQPDSEAPGRRKLCLIASGGIGLTEEASRQGKHENQTIRSDLGCRFLGGYPQTRVVMWGKLNAFALIDTLSTLPLCLPSWTSTSP